MTSKPSLVKSRTLVLCFDGTSNEYSEKNTNVVKFYSLLKKDDFEEQLCYYQAGIGTFFAPGVVSPFLDWGAKMLDYAVAWYLDQHVLEGYSFLMQNYRPGDRICLFGFSRGAYTARALAGMLYKVGLLPKDNAAQMSFAMKLYKRTDKDGVELSKGFKQTFCRHVKIEFMGVWDTVSSVGILTARTLPFTNSNKAIRTFRHALSLDERRTKFRANYYHRPNTTFEDSSKSERPVVTEAISESPIEHTVSSSESSSSAGSTGKKWGSMGVFSKFRESSTTNRPGKSTLKQRGVAVNADTDVKEVWFVGGHGDVGGGNVADSTDHSLNNITLRWMVRQVIQSNCGIVFDGDALAAVDVDFGIPHYFPHLDENKTVPPSPPKPNIGRLPTWTGNDDDVHVGPDKSAKQKAEAEIMAGKKGKEKDKEDAKAKIHDRLKQMPVWWLLELIPTKYTWQDERGVWHHEWEFHRGKGRPIRGKKPMFHFTVKERMEALQYEPKARWEKGTEIYVD